LYYGTQSFLSVAIAVAEACLPGLMVLDVTDAWWCYPLCLSGQHLFLLTPVGWTNSGWEIEASTAVGVW
jgi:hypothetical protein